MNLKKILRNENGFTIVQALIIGAILAALVASFSAYQYQRAKQNKANDDRKAYNELQNALQNTTSQGDAANQIDGLQYQILATPAPTATP